MRAIVISGIGTAGAINIVKAFDGRRDGVRLVGLDCDAVNPGKFHVDSFHIIPRASDPSFLDEVERILEEEKADLFIPVVPAELPIVADALPRLSAVTKVLISPPETIRLFSSKRATLDFFTRVGVPNAGYAKDAKHVTFPVFCKPDGGTGSFHSERVDDREELDRYLRQHPDAIIMPLLHGKEYSVDSFCDKDGRLIGSVARWRMQTKGMGVATKGVTEEIEGLNEYMERIVEGARIIGPFNTQLFISPDGKPSFFEVNPRIGGAFIHSVRAGLDIRQYIIDFIEGKNSTPLQSYRTGLLMVRGWQEHFEQQ